MAHRWSKKKRPHQEDKQVVERNLIAHKVFDDKTVRVLVHLLDKGAFKSLDYPISSGKESFVFRATKADGTYVAVKIFKYETTAFHKFADYLDGDPRFSMRDTLRSRIQLWTRKEFANLKAATSAGVRVPEPYVFKENVVVMEFLGEGGIAYPLLEQTEMENPREVYDQVIDNFKKTYQKAKLVHADLSPFNILYHEQVVFIDWAQAVMRQHQRAEEFLLRDCHNVAKFFERKGVPVSAEDVLEQVRGK